MIRQAREAQQRRDWTSAATLWGAVTKVAPHNAGAWVQLGNMLNELERRDEAVAAFTRAGEIEPALAHAPAGIAGVYERAGRWQAAEAAWREAIALLKSAALDNEHAREELVHAYMHAALSARNTGAPARAADTILTAMKAIPDLKIRTSYLLMRSELLPLGNSETAADLLRDFLRLLPNDIAPAIEPLPDNLFHGLVQIAPHLSRGRGNAAFLKVAAALYRQVRLWSNLVQLEQWQADLDPSDRSHIERAFDAAVDGRLVKDARRLAMQYARETSELLLIHRLALLYDDVRQERRARLLTRFLRRKWLHSRWHAHRYISLTATTRSLALADQLVRQEVDRGQRDRDLDTVYSQAAFHAGHYTEARQRLDAFVARYDDEHAEVLLGYAIANSEGIAAAERHFGQAAARRLQAIGPMTGLAHMAMRRRDFYAMLDRWQRIAAVHPHTTGAVVETARCTYEMRDIDGALRICKSHLQRFPSDLGVAEFNAWLLTVNGQYDDAYKAIEAIQSRWGPSWDTANLSILCSAQLGTLDRDWTKITAMMPSSECSTEISRGYHAMRALISVGRQDLVTQMLNLHPFREAGFAWLKSYIDARHETRPSLDSAAMRQVKTSWRNVVATTRYDFAERLDAMSDIDVSLLLDGKTGSLPAVHIVNKFEQPRGGSELHALDLADQLRTYTTVCLWAPEMPHPEFTASNFVRAIDPGAGIYPTGGVLVIVGVYFDIQKWINLAKPTRIIFLYNTFELPALFSQLATTFHQTGIQCELLYCSDMMGLETGIRGRFEASPINLDLFAPDPAPHVTSQPFIIGRHSRDVVEKHGLDDWKVYQTMAEHGGKSLVLGGTCMRRAFPDIKGLHLLPSRSDRIPDFLRGLDAYFYRTSTWTEPWGRVVIEAMACGLPVVAHAVGGYAQVIKHEVNGLLFDTSEEATRLMLRLFNEPDLRLRLGQEAYRTVRNLLSPAEMRRLLAFYLLLVPS